jgi:hypothetical protein
MNSEETELTFIRCPSCRSLVPAVATRCRMCGHYFEGESTDTQGESGDLAKRKSRVRQRTISVSKDEIEDAAQPEAELETQSAQADSFEMMESFAEVPANEEESAIEETGPERWEAPVTNRPVEREPEPEPELTVPPMTRIEPAHEPHSWEDRRPVSASHPESDEELAEGSFEDVLNGEEDYLLDDEDSEDSSETVGGSPAEETRPLGRKRRRRRRKRRHGGGEQQNVAVAMAVENNRETTVEPKRESIMASQESNMHESAFGRGGDSRSQGNPAFEEAGASAQKEDTLLGWFVNYEQDSRGLAGELRAGRFFIGRQRLRKNDMVIADSAISTPHCLIAASRTEGLKIQDLMSEQGTFIKRKGKDSFVQINDVVTVEHGDCLRFGGYEVLVCLVPFAGRR